MNIILVKIKCCDSEQIVIIMIKNFCQTRFDLDEIS
jgi:hypothetical protein